MSQLSKLSLSRSKAAKRQQGSTPGVVIRQTAAAGVATHPLHSAPHVNGQQRPPAAGSVLRLLDSDDSDWEIEPSQPVRETPAHVLPAAAGPTAAAAHRPQLSAAAVAVAASTTPGAAPLGSNFMRASLRPAVAPGAATQAAAGEPAVQPRRSEVNEFNSSSDEEFQQPTRRPPGGVAPALAASGNKAGRASGVCPSSAAQEAADPQQQALGFRQPQHRKRSFSQEAVQAVGGPAQRHTPAATTAAAAAGPAAPGVNLAVAWEGAEAPQRAHATGPVSAPKHAQAGDGGPPSGPSTAAPDSGFNKGAHARGAKPKLCGSEAAGPERQPPAELVDTHTAVPPEYEDVKAWLQGLQMLQYLPVFVREEIDLSIVHALTAEELASVGITHKVHQATLLAAGRRLGQAQRDARQQPQPLPQRGTPQLEGSGPAVKGPLRGSSAARPQPQQRQGWGPLQPPQQQQQAAGAPRPRPARAGHQSLLQVWQANNLAAAAAEAGCDNGQTAGLGSASRAGPQAPPAEAGSTAQPPEVVGQQQDMPLSSMGTRPMERALLAQLFPDNAVPGPRYQQRQKQQQHAQQAGCATACTLHSLLNPSTVGGLSQVPAPATLWAAAAECRQVAPSMEQRLAKRRTEAGLDAAAPVPQLARGGTAYPQVEESRALKLLKLEALKQELTMHEETVSELKRVIRGMEAELGLE